MFSAPPVPMFGMTMDDFEEDELSFPVWEECMEAVAFFQLRIGTRWVYSGMGSPTGVRWEAVYPLLDRYCTRDGSIDQDKWDDLLKDLELVEIGALEACKPKTDGL